MFVFFDGGCWRGALSVVVSSRELVGDESQRGVGAFFEWFADHRKMLSFVESFSPQTKE